VLTRRQLLVAGATGLAVGASGLVAAACGGGKDDGPTGGGGAASGGGLAFYQAFLDQQPIGPPIRLPLALRNAAGDLDVDLPATIQVQLTPPAGAAPLAPVTLRRHQDGVPRGYYPLVTTFDAPGTWTIAGTANGDALSITVEAKPPGDLPAVPNAGDPLPRIPSPTVGDEKGVHPICTRDPACPFHTTSLDDAIASGKPIVLLVSTPAFCQTAICGPVLELVVDREDQLRSAGAIVIHAEVYVDDKAKVVSPVVDALGMTYEPSLFLASGGGIVRTRLDYTFDRGELGAALDDLLRA
jgi:hypothetical protein